jgi:hypothetical protein
VQQLVYIELNGYAVGKQHFALLAVFDVDTPEVYIEISEVYAYAVDLYTGFELILQQAEEESR